MSLDWLGDVTGHQNRQSSLFGKRTRVPIHNVTTPTDEDLKRVIAQEFFKSKYISLGMRMRRLSSSAIATKL